MLRTVPDILPSAYAYVAISSKLAEINGSLKFIYVAVFCFLDAKIPIYSCNPFANSKRRYGQKDIINQISSDIQDIFL